ncbi:MAG: VWA domain-containing protein [Spirochaetales bacterium]|nr:VWA domain-containing protein [Spirochaetales bacterium]
MNKRKRLCILSLILLTAVFSMSCDLFTSTVEDLFDGGFKLAPVIPVNEIDFEITGIGTGMRGYDNFPSITLFVRPENPDTGEIIPELMEADFFDVIDDNGEARPITVKQPRASAETSTNLVDVVFIMDTTGSMGGYLSTMTAKAQDFAAEIAASDIDYRLGFISFGDDIRKGTGERLAPTSDADAFETAIGGLTAYGGADGPENQIDAIDYARASGTGSNPAGSFQQDLSFTYRTEAMKIFILVTDIGYHTPDSIGDVSYYYDGVYNTLSEEIAKLNDDGINCYVVAPDSGYYNEATYPTLATSTGGVFFDTDDEFSVILDTIGKDITYRGDYMITFMTNDFSPSKYHNIRIAVHTSLGDAEDSAGYTSPATVDYERSAIMLEEYEERMMK